MNKDMTKEYLKCILTEDEIRDNGIALARANSEVATLEARKKEFNDQIKADVSAAESKISKLSMMLQNGYEYRDVECRLERDYENRKVTTWRLDTGENVKTRDMSPDEYQQRLFDVKVEETA